MRKMVLRGVGQVREMVSKGEAFLSYHKTRHSHMKVERNKGGGFTINCGPHTCTKPYLIRVTTKKKG